MSLENVASRLIKRFNTRAKFWNKMINLSFENTPTHLESPLCSICVPTLRLLIQSLHSTGFMFQHYAYSFRVHTLFDLFSKTTRNHLESPFHFICVPTLGLPIQSFKSVRFVFRHYAYSSRVSTQLDLYSKTTPTRLESPLCSICVPTLRLLIQSLHTTPLDYVQFLTCSLIHYTRAEQEYYYFRTSKRS